MSNTGKRVGTTEKMCQNGLLDFFRCNLLSLGAFKIALSHSNKDKIRIRKEKHVNHTLNYRFRDLSSV